MSNTNDGTRVSWADLCRDPDFQGLWIALDNVRYESAGGAPADGEIVDADRDLAALCARIQAAEHGACAIHFCDDGGSGIRRASSG